MYIFRTKLKLNCFLDQQIPVSGILYYVFAPSKHMAILADPVQAIAFIVISMTSCAYLAYLWMEMESPSGSPVKSAANALIAQNFVMKGHRETTL